MAMVLFPEGRAYYTQVSLTLSSVLLSHTANPFYILYKFAPQAEA
jgi:hypothetical protein